MDTLATSDLQKLAAREIDVKVSIGDVLIPATSVIITHAINELPYLDVSFQLDTKSAIDTKTVKFGSTEIRLDKVNKLNRVLQEKIVNDFGVDPDLTAEIIDGQGNALKFQGFVGKPTTDISEGRFSLGMTAVHPMAALQAFNSTIYTSWDLYMQQTQEGEHELVPEHLIELEKTNSISNKIKIILDDLINYYNEQPDSEFSGILSVPAIHRLNKRAYKYVNRLLTKSTEWTRIPGVEDEAFSRHKLHQVIKRTLLGSGSFFEVVHTIAEDFLFQFNTNLTGDGWLEPIQSLEDPLDRTIVAPLEAISFGLANTFEPPVAQVIVQSRGDEFFMLSGNTSTDTTAPDKVVQVPSPEAVNEAIQANQSSLTAMAVFPKTEDLPANVVGQYVPILAPNWVNSDNISVQALENWTTRKQDAGTGFNADLAYKEELTKALQSQAVARCRILEYIAELTFQDLCLKKATAMVEIPLTLTLQPGRTYHVKSSDGQEVFRGFLYGVTHTAAVNDAGAGKSSSHLIFTHVVTPGANLRPVRDSNVYSPPIDPKSVMVPPILFPGLLR